jgi:hypothetical protein
MDRRAELVAFLFLAALTALAACAARTPRESPPPAPTQAEGLAAFATVQAVLQHPRCQNCHPAGDAPLHYDRGNPHGQLVTRGEDGKGAVGMRCDTCHGTRNLPAEYGARVPPGAPHWQMPPARTPMVFEGLSREELAEVLADPARNGGRSLRELVAHVKSDPLVLWGWSPGGDREPVAVPHQTFVAAFETWVAAGAPAR